MTTFSLGKVFATPQALEALNTHNSSVIALLTRYAARDWGCIPEEDAQANRQALTNGGRLMASYPLSDQVKVWVITEADRSVTTLLLPDEY